MLCRVFRKFVRGCFALQVLRFEGEGNGHKREGRNISVILESLHILVHAMEFVTTGSESNIRFKLKWCVLYKDSYPELGESE